MKVLVSTIGIIYLLLTFAFGQTGTVELEGEVSFVTSKNVYVKFPQTGEIEVGDTLRWVSSSRACLVVTNKSSSSCVCVRINDCQVEKGAAIWFRKQEEAISEPIEEKVEEEVPVPDVTETTEEETTEEPMYKEKIRGRVSVSSYSNIGSARDNRNRLMGRFSLNARHINNSKLSLEAYLNFRQINPVNPENFAPQRSFLRVFNLAATYDVRPDLSVTLGRKINPKIASLGAIDGLQAEKRFGKAYVGAILGSRPDILTFSFNPNLLEYGAYGGIQTTDKNFYSQTTLGLIEQRNKGIVDRRYAYLQHSSSIARNLILFSSVEIDLYGSVNGVKTGGTRLTNLFLSGTYRFGRKASLMLSYDTRRRVLYFETFQTEIERLLNDDIARQGVRARLSIRPVKYLNLGVSYGRRYQSNQQNQSDNIHAFASWSKLPVVGGRLAVTYNQNLSSYLTSNIMSIRHSRRLIKDKLSADFYYRRVNYTYENSNRKRLQNYLGTNLSLNISKRLTFRIAGELGTFNQENNYRVYARIIRRFMGRKKVDGRR